MRMLKIVLGNYFLFFSLTYLGGALWNIRSVGQNMDKSMLLIHLLMAALLLVASALLGVAWWSNLRQWESARKWVFSASTLNLVMLIGIVLLYYYREGWGTFCYVEYFLCFPQAIGVIVLVVLLIPFKNSSEPLN
jgi:hypothetical protein